MTRETLNFNQTEHRANVFVKPQGFVSVYKNIQPPNPVQKKSQNLLSYLYNKDSEKLLDYTIFFTIQSTLFFVQTKT